MFKGVKWTSGWTRHIVLLSVVGLLAILFRALLQETYARELREIGKAASEQRALEVEGMWRDLPYADASGPEAAEVFVAKIDWSLLPLSDLQQGKLSLRVAALFRYLQNPSFAEYYRLKTEGLRFQFEPDQHVKDLLGRSAPKDEAGPLPDPKETLEAIWAAVHRQGGNTTVPKITAFCPEHIAAGLSSSNSAGSLLHGQAHKGFTIAEGALDPGIQYLSLQNAPTDGPEAPLYFHLSFFAKMNGSENAGPIYVSLCWLPEEQQWGLSRLIADRWVGMATVF